MGSEDRRYFRHLEDGTSDDDIVPIRPAPPLRTGSPDEAWVTAAIIILVVAVAVAISSALGYV